ncbi:MAG TPA: biotin/lipoyl-binding protein [Acidimicrobiales bacterium]|nr:biotin/lipoyl-binding protein [Acidimicrobiales bacterium]
MKIKNLGGLTRKRAGYIALGLVVVVVAAFGFTSIYKTPASSSAGVARTVKVTKGIVQSSVSASGNLSTVSNANENFVAGGTLTSLNVAVGQRVTAGQVLATIDSTQQGGALQSAESALAVAKMNFTNAQKTAMTQAKTLASSKATLATDQSGGTTVQKDQNQSTLDNAQQQLTNDQTQLATDQTLLVTDQTNLATAQSTYSTDAALGCPAAPSSQGSSGSSSGPVTASAGSVPSVSTGSATSISTTTAVLNATINPNGADTTYYFNYGTTTSLGLATGTFSIPSSANATQVSAEITGLSPSTTYLFEVVAFNTVGSAAGSGVTLTTAVTSCSVDTQTISTDTTKVATDQTQIAKDQSSITVQGLAVQIAQQNVKASPTTVAQDKSTITQDEATIAQGKVGLVQYQATIVQDQASVELAAKSLQETQLVALISGNVTSVSGSVGQTVGGGGSSTSTSTSTGSGTGSSSSPLVAIQGLRQLQVVASFAEADAIKIAVHQTATITLASLPNTVVRGVVTAVAAVSTVVNNVVTYPVTISLSRPPATLKDGMTAQVSVVVQTVSNVLELPSAAITTTGSLSTVQVLGANSVKTTTPVTLGLVGTSFTQITSGVTEGETIAEPTATVSAATSTGATTGGFAGGGGRGFGGGAP